MNFMPADAFERLKKRYRDFAPLMEHPSQFDQEILMAIVTLNGHPGLVTISSRKGEIGKNCQGHGNLVVGVRDAEALAVLFSVQRRLISLRDTPYGTALITEYKKDVTLNEKGPNAASYPVWILKWTFHTPECPKIYQLINNASLVVLENM